ncbi:MAG: KAP family NTPase [Acidimicrobiia bacterium]|nr:KAP family NTPase [Acidimicrobiia bacterium]
MVVLVDDLDRCLPDTVVETLETIRLFLAVPTMAFVIAADEDRVAEAIRQRYPGGANDDPEEPAKLYLHKIVQTTIPLPSLSRFDTEAYLLLLQLANRLDEEQLSVFVDQCGELRLRSGALDDLQVDGVAIADELAFAARLTPMLYEKAARQPSTDQAVPQRPARQAVHRQAPRDRTRPRRSGEAHGSGGAARDRVQAGARLAGDGNTACRDAAPGDCRRATGTTGLQRRRELCDTGPREC